MTKMPKKIFLTFERVETFTVEVSEEMGYDAFPEDFLRMCNYLEEAKCRYGSSYYEEKETHISNEVNFKLTNTEVE